MKDKNTDKVLVVSPIFEEAKDLRLRYKALKATVKNIRKFTEGKIKGRAEC
jgi:hypothetical protein